MSPLLLLVGVVAVLVLAAGVVVGVRVLGGGAPDVDPLVRPEQDRPGPVLLVPGYGGNRGGLLVLANGSRPPVATPRF